MEFNEYLKKSSNEFNSIVCFGADPVLEKIPLKGDTEKKIAKFYSDILDACRAEKTMPGAIKPNYAFYAQYGFEGLRALKKVIEKSKAMNLPVIFDGKRGDIGKTSEAYAREAFDFWQADALTVAPYMGSDSVMPFVKYCEEKGKGIYVLNRTSNAGAIDFQNLMIGKKNLFLAVSQKIVEWGSKAKGNLGAVVGATSTAELKEIAKFYSASGKEVPLLIPGVGTQGGSAEEVTKILKEAGLDLGIQRINSSSGINYAYEKENTTDFAGAAVRAIKELNKEINL